jgi:hypothetical protein
MPVMDALAGGTARPGAGVWLAQAAVLLLRALAVVVLAAPLVLAVAWLLR